jgi:hypothetical protein
LTLQAIALQTRPPNKILIYDDGDHKDVREHPVYKHILSLLMRRNIPWEVVFSPKLGQVACHQMALEKAQTDYIWRIDDDEVPPVPPEPTPQFVNYKSMSFNAGLSKITNDADLDRFLQAQRAALKQALDDGKQILL